MRVTPEQVCARVRTVHAGATEAELDMAERALGVPLPADLRAVLRFSNGFEGPVGDPGLDCYVQLRSTRAIVDENADPAFKQQWPELILFAGDGGGEGFFFDPTCAGPPVLMIAYISDWRTDAVHCANSVGEFFDQLVAGVQPFKRRRGGV